MSEGDASTSARSYYLGPKRSRLTATSWDEIAAAAAAGVLDETHWVELKKDVPATSKEANLELARDLASLSVDGGVLLVGIVDDRGRAGDVVGTAQPRLDDRITAVAQSNISPPLQVTTDRFPDPEDKDTAVLVVTVPMSHAAPHMVDGQYWGRNNTGKYALPDPDVRRMMTERTQATVGFEQGLLDLATTLDPMPDEERQHSHFYLLARPVGGRVPTSLTDHDEPLTAAALLRPAAVPTSTITINIGSASQRIAHPDGLCFGYFPAAEQIRKDRQLLRVLVTDLGTVQLVVGSGTEDLILPGRETVRVIPTIHVLEMTYSFIRLIKHLSHNYLSYVGDWQIGLHIERLHNIPPAECQHFELSHLVGYQTADYTAITTSTAAELTDAPVEVMRRLTRRLLRGLGLEDWHADYSPPAPPA